MGLTECLKQENEPNRKIIPRSTKKRRPITDRSIAKVLKILIIYIGFWPFVELDRNSKKSSRST